VAQTLCLRLDNHVETSLPEYRLAPRLPFDIQQEPWHTLVDSQQKHMSAGKSDILQGTLDLMVLKTLETLGPTHGYGIAVRIEQVSANILQLNQGTLYPALLRLEQKGWIHSEWGESENKRRARFYSLTKVGKKQLREETANWERFAGVMQRVLRPVE
jgi:transcriptional regulator